MQVDKIYAGLLAFVALRTSQGTGECWGFGLFGGDCSAVDFTGVTEVISGSWVLDTDP